MNVSLDTVDLDIQEGKERKEVKALYAVCVSSLDFTSLVDWSEGLEREKRNKERKREREEGRKNHTSQLVLLLYEKYERGGEAHFASS